MNGESKISWRSKRLTLHVIYWFFYVLFFGTIYGKYGNDYQWYFLESVCMLPFVMMATYLTIYVILPFYLRKRKLLIAILSVILVLFLSTLAERIFLRHLNGLPIALNKLFSLSYVYLLLETNFVVATAVIIKIVKKWLDQQEVKHELEKRNLKTELNLLKAQLHPHFLFNTMNNLYALSIEKSAKTSEGIAKISNLLRSVLYDCNDTEIALEKEIKLIENYIDLERMRYGNRLNIDFQVAGDVRDKKIAPMLLFTFVENCFKHGSSNDPENPKIKINLSVSENETIFFAENTKPKIIEKAAVEKAGGIGLNNVKKRLEILYGENYDLKILDEKNTFMVSLIIKK